MAGSRYSIRNAEALLGAETYRLGWHSARYILAFWVPFQIAASFTEYGRQLSGLALLLLVTVFWFYSIPKVIRENNHSGASTGKLAVKTFLRHFLPALWIAITVIGPSQGLTTVALFKLVFDENYPIALSLTPLVIVATWLSIASLLNLLIFGLAAGWRVSLINTGGVLAGMAAALLVVFLSGIAKLAPATRFSLATFLSSQVSVLPMGIALMGWAVRASIGREEEKQKPNTAEAQGAATAGQ